MIVFLSKSNLNIIYFLIFDKYVTAIMITSKSLFSYMVLGIAIGVVMFIIYEKQYHSVPTDGEAEGFLEEVHETNFNQHKIPQDSHLQNNENKGAKTCPHKYVDIFHFKDGIRMMNNDASALRFCTKKDYPESQACSQNTCGFCISYKKECNTINQETLDKCKTLNQSVIEQKKEFNKFNMPILITAVDLINQINKRKGLINIVKANIQDAQRLDASIQTLEEQKYQYDTATFHCKTQPNSQFHRDIKARKNRPSNKHDDLATLSRDSINSPPNSYRCWSNHKIPVITAIYGAGQPLPTFAELKATANKPLGTLIKTGSKMGWLVATPFVLDAIKQIRNKKALRVNNTSMIRDPIIGVPKHLRIFFDFQEKIEFRVSENHDLTVDQQDSIRSALYGDYFQYTGDCGGNDIQKRKNINSKNDCEKICNKLAECKGFTYSEQLKECIPKKKSCSNPTRSGKDGWKFSEKPPINLRTEL